MINFKNSIFFLLVFSTLTGCKNKEDSKNLSLIEASSSVQPIDKELKEDEDIKNFILPYAQKIDQEMNEVISYTEKSMFKTDSKLNTPIGNMMADAVFERISPIAQKKFSVELDGVLLNYGGIRSGISEGNITVKTAYDIMPFENEVVIVELTYEKMEALFDYLAKAQVAHPISGIELEIDSLAEIINKKINSKDLEKGKTYHIATSDYLLKGGDQMNFFLDHKKVYTTDYKLRNLFIDYFKSKDQIDPKKDHRFIKN